MKGVIQLPDRPDAPPATNNFAAKWFLNGFPKAGLHLATQMFKPFAVIMPEGQLHDRPWVGSFLYNSWSDQWQRMEHRLYNLCRLEPGHYFKGHCGWRQDIENFMWYAGVCQVFIYRDPRDVAVSQAYHVISPNDLMKHPIKSEFQAMSEFHEVLSAVIKGHDIYPGVMDRWELYAPWLDVEWVFKFRFEDVLSDPAGTAERLISYGLARIGSIFSVELNPQAESMELMTAAMVRHAIEKREDAATFRRGVPGAWREEFTDEHKELFKKSDRNDWLVRLGYEQDTNW